MKRIFTYVLISMLALSLIAGCSSSSTTPASTTGNTSASTPAKANPTKIILASGPIGGGWYSSAAAIADLLMKKIPGLNVTVTEGSGVTNIKDAEAGTAQLGYTFSDTFNDAINGKGDFNGTPMKKVAGVATLYQSLFQAFTLQDNNKFKSFADLKNGAYILPGMKTYSGQTFTKNLLQTYFNTTYEDIEKNGGKISYTGFSDMVELLKDGHADAAMAVTDAPSSFIMELNSTKKVRFLEVEPDVAQKIQASNPGYAAAQIPANTYDGQTQPVNTIGSYSVIFASTDLPDDFVKQIAQIIVENKAELAANQKSLNYISKETLKSGFQKVPFHPGAEAYLK